MSDVATAATPPIFDIKKPVDYHQIGNDKTRGNDDYIMSCSQLKDFSENPRKWLLSKPNKQTKATKWGLMVDCLVLTHSEFEKQFIVSPHDKFQSNESKNWKATAEASGLIVITTKELDEANAAVKRLEADKLIAKLLKFSRKQVCVRWTYTDEKTGMVVPLKSLIDLLPNKPANSLGDLKTTADASPRKWARTIVDYSYHAQAAMYLDGVNQALGEEREEFFHVISESEDPFEFVTRRLSAEYITFGRLWYRNELERYCQCVMSGEWPAWEKEEMPVCEPPAWLQS